MSLIKKITFESSTNPKEELVLNFCKNKNIIIGPRGAGKSTLFELLFLIGKNKISKKVINALRSTNLNFKSVEFFNGNLIYYRDLAVLKTESDRNNSFDFNNIILQDDPVKKNLNESKDIKNSKKKLLEHVIRQEEVQAFIERINDFKTGMQALNRFKDSTIVWKNVLEYKEFSKQKSNLVLNLNYSNDKSRHLLKNTLRFLDQQIEKFEAFKQTLLDTYDKSKYDIFRSYSEYVAIASKLFSSDFFDSKESQSVFEYINFQISILKRKHRQLKRFDRCTMMFENAYRFAINKLKDESQENKLASFKNEAISHIQSLTRYLTNTNEIFNSFQVKNFIKINLEEKTDYESLKLLLNKTIEIDNDFIVDLMKKFLYTPNKEGSFSLWVKMLWEKGFKTHFDKETLEKFLANSKFNSEIEVLANGKDYKTMSLGERSVYGIEYKLSKSHNMNLFLDQPEDNLDNHTVVENILHKIKDHNMQVFIVTHNANIGILTKPEKIIIANFKSEYPNQYTEGEIVTSNRIEKDGAYYLEGGIENLEERHRIVSQRNKDEFN